MSATTRKASGVLARAVAVLRGRRRVRVTRLDGSLVVAGLATGSERTGLGVWLLVDGVDGRRHRVALCSRVRVEFGRRA